MPGGDCGAGYRRSSYRAHARGAADPLLAGHKLYDRIGGTQAEPQKGYRMLFRTALEDDFLDDLRAATNGGWALGDFKRRIAEALGRRVVPLPKGGPPSAKAERGQLNLL
jgi:putative transposase